MRPKTSHQTPQTAVRQWHLLDAEGQVLGHAATSIAMVLMGKHVPTYSRHFDNGDGVIVVNCEKIRVTGLKAEQKTYARHTGYPGGRREDSYRTWMERSPERIIYQAVKRMMPKTVLGRQMLKKLKIYAGPEHPHVAQQPKPLEIKD